MLKRLFRISFDYALMSIVPIISWFLLSVILDARLINVFSLTYPIQFLWLILNDIFITGANLSAEKDKNPHAVQSGMLLGVLVSGALFLAIILNVDSYIGFMNMDAGFYRDFTIYTVVQLFTVLILRMVLEKLHYENRNALANKYSVIYALLHIFTLIGTAWLTRSSYLTIMVSLVSLTIFVIFILAKEMRNFKFQINLLNCIKYNSLDTAEDFLMMAVFLFGLSGAFSFGEEYATAITFTTLITDTQ